LSFVLWESGQSVLTGPLDEAGGFLEALENEGFPRAGTRRNSGVRYEQDV
jgi:hypothetical protein